MSSQTKRAVANWPMGYCGQDLERGQVFTLQGVPNDEKLLRLRYCGELAPKAETYRCAHCGAEFVGLSERTAHGDKRHPVRPRNLTPDEEDRLAEREEKRLLETAPLALDQTAASRR